MRHEVLITFTQPLVGVVLADLEPATTPELPAVPEPVPFVPPPPAGPSARELELEQMVRDEQAAVQRTLEGLRAAVRDVQAQHRQRLAEQQRVAIELAITIATRLIHDKIAADDYRVEEMARQSISKLETNDPVTLRMHPLDVALLERRLGGQPLLGDDREVRFVADAAVGRGNCMAEAGPISVQAQLERQLAEIREHLLQRLGHAGT